MKKGMLTLLSFTLIFSLSSWAMDKDESAAKNTIENWFVAMKNNDANQAANYLSPKFVSIHTDGMVRNKDEEVTLMKNLNMKSFSLSNFKFSRSGDAIVVTYMDKGSEQIDNQQIDAKSAGRMAVLQKEKDKWIILAYANLDKIG